MPTDAAHAPAASPAPNGAAPAASPAPSSQPGTAPGAAPAAPPPRAPTLWKTKHKIGDVEHELEIDVNPYLDGYKRKVKIGDGEEVEVGLDEAYKGHERVRASMKRFEEAKKLKGEFEQKLETIRERDKRIEANLENPAKTIPFLLRRWGEEKFLEAVVPIVKRRFEYEQLSPDQRRERDQMSAAERAAYERDRKIVERERALADRERAFKAENEKRVAAQAQEREAKLLAEWVPALERGGVPAKLVDPKDPSKTIPNRRAIAMLADVLTDARANKVSMTLAEAVEVVRDEWDAIVGTATKARADAAAAAAAQQPGRTPPAQPTPPPRPQRKPGPVSLEQIERDRRNGYGR